MLPEIVLIENERGTLLAGELAGPGVRGAHGALRAAGPGRAAPPPRRHPVPAGAGLARGMAGRGGRGAGRHCGPGAWRRWCCRAGSKLVADHPFSSKDLLVNLIDGPARGTVLLYRYADVFFCGCTPELLVRKRGDRVESMCLGGHVPCGRFARGAGAACRKAHGRRRRTARSTTTWCRFIREVFRRTCYDVDVPAEPGILPLTHVQHLCTPARARMLEGVDLWTMRGDLHPTPAVAGTPVGEAKMLIRRIEAYNRGFFAGACGYVDGDGRRRVFRGAAHRRVRRRGGLGLRGVRHRRWQRRRCRIRRNRHEAANHPERLWGRVAPALPRRRTWPRCRGGTDGRAVALSRAPVSPWRRESRFAHGSKAHAARWGCPVRELGSAVRWFCAAWGRKLRICPLAFG